MKKIIFVLIQDQYGGIEKSFVNLVNELAKDTELLIDVLFFYDSKTISTMLPPNIRILQSDKKIKIIGMSQNKVAAEEGRLFFLRLCIGFINKYLSQNIGYTILMSGIQLKEKYDFAVSYQHNRYRSLYGGTNEFVLKHVDAKKKIAFIHCDFELAKINSKYNRTIYNEYDGIVSVSQSCKKILEKYWPQFQNKSYCVHNLCDEDNTVRLAGKGFPRIREKVCFITVARLDKVKGIKRTLKAFYHVKKTYSNFVWYIVGDGKLRKNYNQYVKKIGLDKQVVFLGEQSNPYFYMKNMDAILVLSYQEAAPMVFEEAKCLKIPVLSTNTVSAKELIEDRKIGLVCDNSLKGIESLLMRVISDATILEELKNNMNLNYNEMIGKKEFYTLLKGV